VSDHIHHIMPTASRPAIPDGYGVPDDDNGLLDWQWAEQRLAATARSGSTPPDRTATEVGKPDPDVARRLAAAFAEKFGAAGYRPKPDQWDGGGLYAVTPTVAFGWEQFPTSCTRWHF